MLMTAAILGLFLIGIAAVVSALILSRSAEHELERRIDLVSLVPAGLARAQRADGVARARAKIDDLLCKVFALGMRQRWALHASGLSLLAVGCASAAVTFILTHWIPGPSNWIGLGLGAGAFFLVPHLLLRAEQAHVDAEFIDRFPDAVDMIVRMLRAGLPVTATVRTVAQEAPAPVNLAFAELANQMDIGIPFEDALRQTAEKIGLGDFRYFSVAASLQRTTGGNLAATLDSLSDIIRRKRAGRLKAKAVTAEVRMTALILGCLPIFIVIMLMIMRPDYLAPLISDPRGNIIIGVAGGLLLAAFVVIRQMMRSVTGTQ